MKRLILVLFLFVAVDLFSQCSAVTGLTANNVQQTTATISWNPVAGAGSYSFVVIVNGITVLQGNTSLTSLPLTNLTPNTFHQFSITTNCTNGSVSTTGFGFTTRARTVPNYTPMRDYGYSYKRIRVDSTFEVPADTMFSKNGLAVLNGTIYVGNGTRWSVVQGGSTGSTDWADITNKPTMFPTNYANSGSVRDSIQERLNIWGQQAVRGNKHFAPGTLRLSTIAGDINNSLALGYETSGLRGGLLYKSVRVLNGIETVTYDWQLDTTGNGKFVRQDKYSLDSTFTADNIAGLNDFVDFLGSTKKNKEDSTATTGYTTRGTTRRLIDSLRGALPPTFFNGDYNGLTNRPDLSVYVQKWQNWLGTLVLQDATGVNLPAQGRVQLGESINRSITGGSDYGGVQIRNGLRWINITDDRHLYYFDSTDNRVIWHEGNLNPSIYATTASTNAALQLKLNITDTANIRPRLAAGNNITITGTYPNLTIASTGGGGGNVTSVNGQTGTVVLNANDVGALPAADSALYARKATTITINGNSQSIANNRAYTVDLQSTTTAGNTTNRAVNVNNVVTITDTANFNGLNQWDDIHWTSIVGSQIQATTERNGIVAAPLRLQPNNGIITRGIGPTLDTLASLREIRQSVPRILNRTTQSLTYNSTLVLNAANGANATVTLTGNAALSFTNTQDGDEGSITFIQDATGSRIVTIPAGSFQGYGVTGTTLPLSTVAGRRDEVFWKRKGSVFIFSTMQNLVN